MARTFNGTTQYLVIGSALLTAYPISFACWCNPVNNTGAQAIIGVSSTVAGNSILLWVNSGKLTARSNNAGTNASAISVASLTTGAWNHCVGVFVNATSRLCYLNGVSASNATSIAAPTANRTAIGIWFNSSTTPINFANSTLAYPAIWQVALSATDAASLYAGASPLMVQPSQLVSYPRMIGDSPESDLVSPTTWLVSG